MTLDELIAELQEKRDDLGTGEGRIYIAAQPSYPLTHVISNVISNVEMAKRSREDEEEDEEEEEEDEKDVWIAVDQIGSWGPVSGYAPRAPWGY